VKRSEAAQARQLSPDVRYQSALLRDPRWELVQRVAASSHLRSSTRLRDFLLYIAECAIREAPEDATEQQIGVHVFRRSPGYNSSEDSIVRTHARLLRQKLAAYFADEGRTEAIVIDVPKGHYLPVFHPREMDVKSVAPLTVAELPAVPLPAQTPVQTVQAQLKSAYRIALALAIALIVALTLSAVLIAKAWPKHLAARSAVDTLWAPFLTGDPPLVIYSNALFLGDSKTGLRYPPPDASPTELAAQHSVDHYTGIGELAAVYQLTRFFDARHASFILKRSLLVAWDEAKLTNLVFIGSPAENSSLKVLPSARDFTLTSNSNYSGFINQHPKTGEPTLFSRPEHPLTKDYAILALLPSVEPGKQMLIFSGLTTLGTQAAVEYACSPENVAELLKTATSAKGQVRPFEAVLEVNIGGGVPLQTKLVSLHVH
jgi:hypothetical protein